jgi:O-antigen/teichoic acid export membrane protein
MMVYFDRFIIAATISTEAVAYYTTPYEVVTKLLVFPAALSGVLFPAFAASFLIDQLRCKNLYDRGIKYISITLFPVTLIIVAFAHEGLSWWVGPVFAEQGAFVLKCLAAGVYMNALAYMPFALIQGAGRPDLTAKVHFIELPIYLFTLWTLTNSLGIKGAAIAWTLRVSMDAVVMLRIATYLFKQKDKATHQHAAVIGTGLAILALAASLDGVLLKSTLLIIVLLGFTAIVWFLMLSENEKRFTRESGKKLLARCST